MDRKNAVRDRGPRIGETSPKGGGHWVELGESGIKDKKLASAKKIVGLCEHQCYVDGPEGKGQIEERGSVIETHWYQFTQNKCEVPRVGRKTRQRKNKSKERVLTGRGIGHKNFGQQKEKSS